MGNVFVTNRNHPLWHLHGVFDIAFVVFDALWSSNQGNLRANVEEEDVEFDGNEGIDEDTNAKVDIGSDEEDVEDCDSLNKPDKKDEDSDDESVDFWDRVRCPDEWECRFDREATELDDNSCINCVNRAICVAMPCECKVYCVACARLECLNSRGKCRAIGKVQCDGCYYTWVDKIIREEEDSESKASEQDEYSEYSEEETSNGDASSQRSLSD